MRERAEPAEEPDEGWYLMSTQDLEEMLRHRRAGSKRMPANAVYLTIGQALAYRDAGNLPDDHDRTLRLLLFARDRSEVRDLSRKRARFEPDYQEGPVWRRQGSKPVNVVPLGGNIPPADAGPWWDEPELAALESEWNETGAVQGLRIPAGYRGFLYKTILSLRSEHREVSVESITDSIARWLGDREAAEIRSALDEANHSDLRGSPEVGDRRNELEG